MKHPIRAARLGPLFAATASILLVGCESFGTGRPGSAPLEPLEAHAIIERDLERVNPVDIVVLPVRADAIGRADLPLEKLRTAFAEGLIKLRYSPLAFEYVDSRIVDASYDPGSSSEEAILEVVLQRWDDSHWQSHTRIDVRADVRLLDASRPDSTALWGGPISTTIDLNHRRAGYATREALLHAACEEFVNQVLAQLPPRKPEVSVAG